MMHFILISDVFCPWCLGFSPVMQQVAAAYPDVPFHVLNGNLVATPVTLESMRQEHPNMKAFFERLARTTGLAVGEAFLRRLDPGHGTLRLASAEMAVPLAALRKLVPGQERQQMENLQKTFYVDGLDVLLPEMQARAGGVETNTLLQVMQEEEVQLQAHRDSEEALTILDEFVVYPSLFLVTDDGQRHILARGYTTYETVAARLAAALKAMPHQTKNTPVSAEACGLDGSCPL